MMNSNNKDLVRLTVASILRSHSDNGFYAVVLHEANGPRRVQIVIGSSEANAIECVLCHLVPSRPLTHDLMASVMKEFGIKVEAIVIEMLPGGIYAAKLLAYDHNRKVVLDSRSSDAIALAVRLDIPIYMSRQLLESVGILINDNSSNKESIFDETEDSLNTPESRESYDHYMDFSGLSTEELKIRQKRAVSAERYELASLIKQELERRESSKNNFNETTSK